jgi:hypothetical protein
MTFYTLKFHFSKLYKEIRLCLPATMTGPSQGQRDKKKLIGQKKLFFRQQKNI